MGDTILREPDDAATGTGRAASVHRIRRFHLESGEVLRDVRQLFYLDGELNEARDNLVVVFHALTGSADAAGEWWSEVVGPGLAIDTERYAVLCTNLLGSCYGTTGPADGRTSFPGVTPRDMARLVHQLVASLGVRSVALAVGGSLGGMVALEWAAIYPVLTRNVVVLAAPAAHTASSIAWSHIQRRAIDAAGFEGVEIARMVAMMTYRTGAELEERFGRRRDAAGGFEVERWLDAHGEKLRARFDLRSYLALLEAMDSHDLGRDRGGIAPALAAFTGRLLGVGIPGDLLYTDEDVREWVRQSGSEYREIRSVSGHDAFLLEHEQVSAILAEVLEADAASRPEALLSAVSG